MREADPGHPGLSARQCSIVQVIEDSVQETGYAPSFREIGDAVGLASASSVAYQLKALQRMGYLRHVPGRPRAIVLRDPVFPRADPREGMARRGLAPVPLVGQTGAGWGILAQESVEGVVPLPKQLVGEGNLIMLRVVGESMIDAAIADGDWVVVRRESDIENGDIVVAMIETEGSSEPEATVKTFKRVDGHAWLIPHNPAYEPLIADDAKIIGKVVSVLRRLLRGARATRSRSKPTPSGKRAPVILTARTCDFPRTVPRRAGIRWGQPPMRAMARTVTLIQERDVLVRPVHDGDRPTVEWLTTRLWGAPEVVVHDGAYYPAMLPGFIAERAGRIVGLVTFEVRPGVLEIVTINALHRYEGIGTMLIEAVRAEAKRRNCREVMLTTTNDNVDALRFYQRRGFRLAALRPGAVDRSRQIRPSIPHSGDYGIPLHDEIDLSCLV